MLSYIPKTRPNDLKQFGISNAQHFMNFVPKVAKIARKRLFTNLSLFINEQIYPQKIYNILKRYSKRKRPQERGRQGHLISLLLRDTC
jgi:hypothetical protein